MQRHYLALVVALVSCGFAASAGAEDGRQKAAVCAACHGADGNSITPEWPKLAGQHSSYLRAQLAAFKAGTRKNAMMSPMAANLSDGDMSLLADYYSSQSLQFGEATGDNTEAGQRLYRGGNASSGVPACMACHGPRGSGNPAAGYPTLHGQHAAYTAIQLKAYRSGERASDINSVMRSIAARMTDAEIDAVAGYLQGLH
jgi:cytochrome c553